MKTRILGLLPDFRSETFLKSEVIFEHGRITSVQPSLKTTSDLPYILPGFIDSHVHIESSMLPPSEFARLAVVHGTVATVSDPHEIANVCGLQGVYFMLENGRKVPFKFNFGAPSCVPATSFETAGAQLDSKAVAELIRNPEIKYLSEMMNFPGVLTGDKEVLEKMAIAKKYNKPIDGHAPGLKGKEAQKYIAAGITTDHECFTIEEALDKLKSGMQIIIRDGSAAKNFDTLIDLLNDFPDDIMFCSDDKHPDSLIEGHINKLCARAVAKGIDIFKILKAACLNPVEHYHLDVGLLQPGDPADLILVEDLESFEVRQTYIDGLLVAERGSTLIKSIPVKVINQFNISRKKNSDLEYILPSTGPDKIEIIEALDGQLITNKFKIDPSILLNESGYLASNPEVDILKIAVVNRYREAPVAKAFIKNFGLKKGAMASSVAHDSHNIVAIGVDDKSMLEAINLIIQNKGGLSFCLADSEIKMTIPLPIAGLMSDRDGYQIAEEYIQIDQAVKNAGSALGSPFMTLSFMALLVIPHLKLSDRGLFDGDRFALIGGI